MDPGVRPLQSWCSNHDTTLPLALMTCRHSDGLVPAPGWRETPNKQGSLLIWPFWNSTRSALTSLPLTLTPPPASLLFASVLHSQFTLESAPSSSRVPGLPRSQASAPAGKVQTGQFLLWGGVGATAPQITHLFNPTMCQVLL